MERLIPNTVEYVIKVTNNGTKEATIESLIDDLPAGFSFEESKNTGWKIVDGQLENVDVRGAKLQPGETKEVKLILTWEQSELNFGAKTNTATAKAENEIDPEDNKGQATIIIGITTGGVIAISGISIILVALIIAGLGTTYKRMRKNKK